MKTRLMARVVLCMVLLAAMASVLPAFAQGPDELTEEFVTSDGVLSFSYPAGWHAEDYFIPGMAMLVSKPDLTSLMEDDQVTVPSGEIVMALLGPQVAPLMFGGGEAESMEAAMALLAENSNESTTTFSDPEAVQLGELDGLVSLVQDEVNEGAAFVVDVNAGYVLVMVMVAPGEYEDLSPTVEAILASVVFGAADEEATLTFEAEDGSLSFDYPVGWVALSLFDDTYMLMNKFVMEDVVISGQISVMIFAPPALATYGFEETPGPAEFAQAFGEMFVAEEDVVFGEAEVVLVGDYDAVQVGFAGSLNEGVVLVVDIDGAQMLVFVTAAVGELGDFEAELALLLDTLAYTPVME